MVNCEEARCKLTSTKINELKSTAEDKTGTTSRTTQKRYRGKELPHEL